MMTLNNDLPTGRHLELVSVYQSICREAAYLDSITYSQIGKVKLFARFKSERLFCHSVRLAYRDCLLILGYDLRSITEAAFPKHWYSSHPGKETERKWQKFSADLLGSSLLSLL